MITFRENLAAYDMYSDIILQQLKFDLQWHFAMNIILNPATKAQKACITVGSVCQSPWRYSPEKRKTGSKPIGNWKWVPQIRTKLFIAYFGFQKSEAVIIPCGLARLWDVGS